MLQKVRIVMQPILTPDSKILTLFCVPDSTHRETPLRYFLTHAASGLRVFKLRFMQTLNLACICHRHPIQHNKGLLEVSAIFRMYPMGVQGLPTQCPAGTVLVTPGLDGHGHCHRSQGSTSSFLLCHIQ